jgi:glycosyltransferase involved in cell wall biosynthesis
MKCLWLSLADPDPRTNGQYIYSGGLIDALIAAGATVTVAALARETATRPAAPQIVWRLAGQAPQTSTGMLLSPWPQVSSRSRSPGLRRTLAACLAESWDAIVFDSIALGWALQDVLRHQQRNPDTALVYLSHNHEQSVAQHIAANEDGSLPRRLLRGLDALKVSRLERRLLRHVDLVTANTPEDVEKFVADARAPSVALLRPGYGGNRSHREIEASLPRRAVIVGSFDWLPKRISLEAFLAAAVPIFEPAGIGLQIVGQAEAGYLARVAAQYPAVEFTGAVPDIRPYLAEARIALVPDLLGGFKLKTLDYVFHRVPIFAMQGAVPGTPLVNGVSIRDYASHAALARGVAQMIDDIPALNAQQAAAYAACDRVFDWSEIGSFLLRMLHDTQCRRRDRSGVGILADIPSLPLSTKGAN